MSIWRSHANGDTLRTTLGAVARAAGVSSATVSNVVNGKFDMMSAGTRHAIQRLIDNMNYRPHSAARSLRLALRHTIGLVIVDPSPSFLADPFNAQIAAGLGNHLNRNGFGLLINGGSAAGFGDGFVIRNRATDALCLIPSGSAEERRAVYRIVSSAAQPVLVFQDRPPGRLTDIAWVRQDDRQGGRLLGERLLARGARRLVMLVPERTWPAMLARQRGVRDALAAAAGGSLIMVHTADESLEATQRALAAHIGAAGLPDAILGGNDQMAIAILKWLLASGRRVPADVMVTGFNALFHQHSTPTLTTVRSPAYAMGERGAALLLSRLAGGRFARRETILEVSLLAGDSD